MRKRKVTERRKSQTLIEEELVRTLSAMKTVGHETAEYAKMLKAAELLHDMLDDEVESSDVVSKDVMASVCANLIGIILIIKHEQVNVITSKALGFVLRTKLPQNRREPI